MPPNRETAPSKKLATLMKLASLAEHAKKSKPSCKPRRMVTPAYVMSKMDPEDYDTQMVISWLLTRTDEEEKVKVPASVRDFSSGCVCSVYALLCGASQRELETAMRMLM
jgi:hypothetical protein